VPAALEARLRREGRKRGYKGERLDRFVFGGLRKSGWKPSHQKQKSKAK
jgi:hypothetical protein